MSMCRVPERVVAVATMPCCSPGGPPAGAVAGAGAQGVGDLVQQGVADLVDAVEEGQGARKGDALVGIVAPAEAAAGVVEAEGPAGVEQAVLPHQAPGEVGGFVEVHQVGRLVMRPHPHPPAFLNGPAGEAVATSRIGTG